jgi:hypothetical protein
MRVDGCKAKWIPGVVVAIAIGAACGDGRSKSGSPTTAELSCAGTPTACGLLSASQCTSAPGCAPGACSGTATACDGFTSGTECLLQQGCTPNGNGGACSGAARACLAFSVDSECRGQRGCAWQPGCSGRAATCASLNASSCLSQPGCHLAAASTDAATDGASQDGSSPGRNCEDAGVPVQFIVDDMEDQTQAILGSDAYGSWYVYGDDTIGAHMTPAPNTAFSMEPIPGGRCASEYAMRMSGTGFTTWGAGMGFDFGYGGTTDGGAVVKIPVDAHAYSGVRFWARVGEATTKNATFSILAGNCPVADGGADAGAVRAPSDCALSFQKPLTLTNDWVRYDITFDDLLSNPGRLPIARDQIYSFGFLVSAGMTFDLWIDDISWIPSAPEGL